MRKQIYCLLSLLWISCLSVSAADRWVINPAGGITWQIDERVPHEDHIEMSGLKVSTVLRYGVDANGSFMLNRSMVWPMLRTIPNNTTRGRLGWRTRVLSVFAIAFFDMRDFICKTFGPVSRGFCATRDATSAVRHAI